MEIKSVKDDFKALFEETINCIKENYSKTDEQARIIVGTIINNNLKLMQVRADLLNFVEFYKTYDINKPSVFNYNDFTVSQIKQIIEESPMSLQDKKIAYKMFAERKTYETIAEECDISQPLTISNNKDRIKNILKQTCGKIYKGGTKS